ARAAKAGHRNQGWPEGPEGEIMRRRGKVRRQNDTRSPCGSGWNGRGFYRMMRDFRGKGLSGAAGEAASEPGPSGKSFAFSQKSRSAAQIGGADLFVGQQ